MTEWDPKNIATYARHHDDEGFDEIHITTRTRYKTSGLSGDEWRISALIQVKRKGEVIFERGVGSVDAAARLLPGLLIDMGFTPGFDTDAVNRADRKCAQPGCSNDPVSEYRFKKKYCREGHATDPIYDERTRFCAMHLRRGDCGLEDADSNYEVVSGPWPDRANWQGADIRESGQLIVNVDSPDQ